MDKHSSQLLKATMAMNALPPDMASYIPSANDRLIEKREGVEEQRVLTVLLVRNDHVIAQYLTGVKTGSKRVIKFPAFAGVAPQIDGVTFDVYTADELRTPSTAPVKPSEPDGAAAAAEPAIKKKRGEGPTKMSKCREIYAANPGLDKIAMKALFVSDAGCTVMGANTYLLTIMKG